MEIIDKVLNHSAKMGSDSSDKNTTSTLKFIRLIVLAKKNIH